MNRDVGESMSIRVVDATRPVDCERFINPQSIYWFLYFTANFICKSTKLDGFISAHLYIIHTHTRARAKNRARTQLTLFGYILLICRCVRSTHSKTHTLCICLFFFFLFIILILCWFFFQGTKYDKRYPIAILMGLGLFGAVCGLFLPETLHQKLPDSVHEAREFGANQVYTFLL